MKKGCYIIIFTCIFLFLNTLSYSQKIGNAYWYNFPCSNIKIGDKNIEVVSFFTFETDSSLFDIEFSAISDKDEVLYKRALTSDSKDYYIAKKTKDVYRVEVSIPYLLLNPAYILIKNNQNNTTVKFACEYVNLSGTIQSIHPSIKYIGIIPDGFDNKYTIYQQTDSSGYYQCSLPERKYSFVLAVDDKYAKNTLETWYNDIQLTCNKTLDFNIYNGEIYNLHLWKNKGGGNSLFITFRPMIIDKQIAESGITINNRLFESAGNTVHLNPDNLEISINGNPCNIITMQSFYETGTYSYALLSYLLQIELNTNTLDLKMNELELYFKTSIQGISYTANAKVNFDYDQL